MICWTTESQAELPSKKGHTVHGDVPGAARPLERFGQPLDVDAQLAPERPPRQVRCHTPHKMGANGRHGSRFTDQIKRLFWRGQLPLQGGMGPNRARSRRPGQGSMS